MADWTKPFSASYTWMRVPRSSYATSNTGLEIGEVSNIVDGTIEVSDNTATFESASIELVGPLVADPSDLLRCHMIAAWEDGTTEDVVLGTFNVSIPSRDVHGSYETCGATLDGRLIELDEDAFDKPWIIPKNRDPLYYVRSDITDPALMPWVPNYSSTPVYATTSQLSYGSGTDNEGSVLDAVNDVLRLTGFRAAKTDEYGRFLLQDPIDYDGPAVWTFREGSSATFLTDATDELDASAVCNVVHAIYETPDATVVGVAVDSDPSSPWSTVTLGRRKVATYQFSDTVTQAAADARAAELLYTQQSVVHRVTIQHVWCGVRVGDVVALDYPSAGISGKFAVRAQSIKVGSAGCMTTSELRRFERG